MMSSTIVELSSSRKGEFLPFQVLFQPIVDLEAKRVYAYEALTRGADGTSYPDLVKGLTAAQLSAFNRRIAVRAMHDASSLGIKNLDACLSINIDPDIREGALDASFIYQAARHYGVAPKQVVLELTEDHKVSASTLRELLNRNRKVGFATAMDDFGAGYSGLTMLVDCRPEVLKLDRGLIRGIDHCDVRQKLVCAFLNVCQSLGMAVVAEGVETPEECSALYALGIKRMQGFLFSRPSGKLVQWAEEWEGFVDDLYHCIKADTPVSACLSQ